MNLGEINHVTTRYTLADGTEVLRSLDQGNERLGDYERTWVNHPTLGAILVRNDRLAKVEPSLPPEPADQTIWYDPQPGVEGDVWQRSDLNPMSGSCWMRVGEGSHYDWAGVNQVTDPAKWIQLIRDDHGILAAARAWRARIVDPPNMWADDQDFALIAAVDAETAARAAAEQEASKP